MKGWRLTSTAGGDTSHNPRTHARSDCAKAFSCCRLASRPSPRDSRRRQPTVAAAAHARLAQSYAARRRLSPSRPSPAHPRDASVPSPRATARRQRQAVSVTPYTPRDPKVYIPIVLYGSPPATHRPAPTQRPDQRRDPPGASHATTDLQGRDPHRGAKA